LFRDLQQSQHPQQQSAIPPQMHLTIHHKMESARMLPRIIPTMTGHLLQEITVSCIRSNTRSSIFLPVRS
jgi:hypothetical protein